MLKLIEDLPSDALGVEAVGKVTHEDYRTVLIPAAEAMFAKGRIKMLFVAGPAFTGYALEAMWDDAAFGLKHWSQFDDIAIVTDHPWLRSAVTMFRPFFPGQIRLFKYSDITAAKNWIAGKENARG